MEDMNCPPPHPAGLQPPAQYMAGVRSLGRSTAEVFWGKHTTPAVIWKVSD